MLKIKGLSLAMKITILLKNLVQYMEFNGEIGAELIRLKNYLMKLNLTPMEEGIF